MVINTQARFIFVHIPKTAGSSIMASLKSMPGNNETWLAKTKHETLSELYANIERRLSTMDKVTRDDLFGYYSFAFVRNPWDRMLSLYRYLCESRPRPEIDSVASFKDFLVQAKEGTAWISSLHSMRPQVDFFSFPDGYMSINFLGHFEYLYEDIKSISEKIEIPGFLKLEHKNASSNKVGTYRHYYDDEMIEIVASLFADDCFYFGYDFERVYPARRWSGQLEVDPDSWTRR